MAIPLFGKEAKVLETTEIADRVFRVSMVEEADVMQAGLVLPGSYNMFVIAADQPVIINTMMRRTFERFRQQVSDIVDPAALRFIVVSHHEGDTDGAINEWLADAPEAVPVSTELCAVLSLRDLSERAVRVVTDGEVIDLGSHRLRFLSSPYVNQWDSMMVYEESTGTMFPNDLFACPVPGDVFDADPTEICLTAAREFGYMANDRSCLESALDKVAACSPQRIAPMHGPVLTTHLDKLIEAFQSGSIEHVDVRA
jgi:flavorubredoxin